MDRFEWDSALSGFGLRERNGRKTWIVQYRLGHQQRRLKVGSAEKLTKAQAREAARKMLAKVELGHDPAAEKAQARKDAKFTVKTLAADYLRARKAQLKESTYRNLTLYLGVDPDAGAGRKRKRDLTGYWSVLHSVPISRVTRRDVAVGLGKIIREHGATPAARARTTLSGFYAWCVAEGVCEHNPVIGTNVPAENGPRDRVLSDGEVAAVWKAAPDSSYGVILRMLILIPFRREEVGGLRMSEVDVENRTINLPAERCKNGHAFSVPLSDFAWSILEPALSTQPYVFGRDGAGPFTGWSHAKDALDKALGGSVAAFRLHDIRRSIATHLGDLGFAQPHIVECILNHTGGFRAGVKGVYNRAVYAKEVRAALTMWSDRIRTLVEGGERKIVPMSRAGA
jgi:integrase